MRIIGKLKGNKFIIKSNGEQTIYDIIENKVKRKREVSEDYTEEYIHTIRVAYDKNGHRVGNIEPGKTGYSYFLNKNNK